MIASAGSADNNLTRARQGDEKFILFTLNALSLACFLLSLLSTVVQCHVALELPVGNSDAG